MRRSPRSGRSRTRRSAVALGGAAALALTTAVPFTAASADDGVTDLGSASSYGATAEPTGLQASTSPTGAWFVQTAGEATRAGGSASENTKNAKAVRAEAKALGVKMKVRDEFSALWSGLSVEMSDKDAALLAESSAVTAIYPVLIIERPDLPSSSERPEMTTAISQTGADIAHSELGFTGAGMKIAIIDTGVDYNHPDLGGDGEGSPFPNDRVTFGYDFVGDDFNASTNTDLYDPVPKPDGDPDDCGGHGTHVAGIAAGSGDPAKDGVRGVAPEATIGAYRVFGCDGSTTSDVMIAAMERALADGMDVVNMSIGSAFATWPEYPTSIASSSLVNAGVTVVASAGNEGDRGLWAAGAPGTGADTIGVASFDNTTFTGPSFVTDAGDDPYVYIVASDGAGAPPTEGALPLAIADQPLACETLTGDYSGQAVVIQRGECSFYQKASNAAAAGAAAVVLYNNVDALVSPTVDGDPKIEIPVVALSLDDGTRLVESIRSGAVTELTWTDNITRTVHPNGGLMSAFSSYGLAADLSLKPNLGGPGGAIWSTIPLDQDGGYGLKGGTSMSAPHVAGGIALILQARGDMTPAGVRDLLQNTADPAPWSLNPDIGLLEPTFRQGAGMIDIDAAILAETTISPGQLSLGESEAGPTPQTLTLSNTSDIDVTYTIGFEDAVSAAGDPDAPDFLHGVSTVDAPESVTVPAGGETTIEVSIAPHEDLEQALYGGYLILSPKDGEVLRVPYAGFAGDYQALPLLGDIGQTQLPVLGKLVACKRLIDSNCAWNGEYNLVGAGTTYSMKDGDVPTYLVHLDSPAQSVDLTVYAAVDGKRGSPVGPTALFSDNDNVGRSGGSGAFEPFTWDGSLKSVYRVGRHNEEWQVPDGKYIIGLEAVNALGDPQNPDHVEMSESPVFTIDRDGDGNPPGEFDEQLRDVPPKMRGKLRCIVNGTC